MKGKFCILLCSMFVWVLCVSGQRHWTVANGLPTGEVHQIVELPNGQMLVNCEGVFCLSNGHSFDVVSCNQILAYKLSQYTNRYGQLWEGDSILWLRDFYRIYRFDAHQYRFVKTDEDGLGRPFLKTVLADKADTPQPTAQQQHVIDSLHIHDATVAITDRQGGLWIGTRTNGIVYQPPHRTKPMIHTGNDPLIGQARSASLRNGQTMFVIQIDDDRQLRCDSLSHLAYAQSDHTTIPLNEKLPVLNQYRHMVGACPLDEEWVAVYTHNGAFLLDTKADTLAPFPHAYEIECYSSKYNCMLKDHKGTLWVGTQNGLFKMEEVKGKGTKSEKYKTPDRIEGLTNNCIRSLVTDADGHVWTGTSYGISRITPTVVNLGVDDGIPAKPMMDCAALLLTDKRLVFAAGGGLAVSFRPDEQLGEEKPLPVVITNITINGETVESSTLSLLGNLSYKQNYLSFQFSTLNYATPSHDHYRYRIRNLESEWNTCSDGGGQCTAIYRALPPDDYTFEVQAATASSEWGTVTTFQFAIRPPWWLTWWMKTAYGLATILMIVGLISVYLQKKKAKLRRENDARVNHLFELREEARHQFAESANISPDKIAINAEEEKLVSQMLKAIEAHIDNEQYNADLLARDVAMSRASLYKKLQNMLGVTPTDFIRKVRLKRAAQLLTESQLSINEIATHVGFATARNFSSSFKKIFGVTPSEYRNREENAKKTHN